MNAFPTSSIFHSYQPLQGIIVSSVLLLTSTLPHISHICLLYSLKSHFSFVSGLDKYSTASLREVVEACDGVQMQCIFIFIIFPLGDIYNPNTHIVVILRKYH